MQQMTGQNRFTRSLSGGYKMTNGSRVRTGEAIKESVVRESTELAVDKRVEDENQWLCQMNFMRSSAMSDVFIVLFHISTYRTSDLFAKVILVSRACFTYNFASPTPSFCLITAVRFLSRV